MLIKQHKIAIKKVEELCEAAPLFEDLHLTVFSSAQLYSNVIGLRETRKK